MRRTMLVWRARVQAWRVGSTVDITLPGDMLIGRGVRTEVKPGCHTVIRIGSGFLLGDGVTFLLYGGELLVGDGCYIRRGCTVSIGGRLVMEGVNGFGYGVNLHCGQSLTFDRLAGVAEYCTVADSTHFHTEPDKMFHHNTAFAPVKIGQNTFLAPRVSVGRGVTIGAFTIVGPNSVVVKDLPGGVFASGSPASVIRQLDLPWLDGPRTEQDGTRHRAEDQGPEARAVAEHNNAPND
jgi:acetyltransferase-like isoleucine patch superfamily enzyme